MIKRMLFSELKKMLFRLHFTLLSTEGSHYVFQHSLSDTLIILPEYQDDNYIDLIHLVAVKRILLEHGLIDSFTLNSFEQKDVQLSK